MPKTLRRHDQALTSQSSRVSLLFRESLPKFTQSL
jgi:hypothetical protein